MFQREPTTANRSRRSEELTQRQSLVALKLQSGGTSRVDPRPGARTSGPRRRTARPKSAHRSVKPTLRTSLQDLLKVRCAQRGKKFELSSDFRKFLRANGLKRHRSSHVEYNGHLCSKRARHRAATISLVRHAVAQSRCKYRPLHQLRAGYSVCFEKMISDVDQINGFRESQEPSETPADF